MAWENTIDQPGSLFSMFKPERPLIDIPPPAHHTSALGHGHSDPLRTPEDVPVRHQPPLWYESQIDDIYHITPFAIDDEHAHGQHRFPDVEDAGWDMSLVSPPSPSRRTMEMLPELDNVHASYDNMDMDEPPTLSPPSPSRRSLTLLPDADWQPDMDDCPQLSPPSPIHCNSALPPLGSEFDTHPRFIEDTHNVASSQPIYSHNSPSPLAERLHTEHKALMSLRDRTVHAEFNSRLRNAALRGRERELGHAVAALRDAHGSSATSTTPPCDNPTLGLVNESPAAAGLHPPDQSLPTPTEALHAYRTLATSLMLERTEEKRRRKKDKERIKELRVILGVGVHALLCLACGSRPHENVNLMGAVPAHFSAIDATKDLGIGPSALTSIPPALALHAPEPEGSSMLLAAHEAENPPHEDILYIAPQKTLISESGLGLDLSLEPPLPASSTSLADRTVAMRRLVARMTMRRRYLGMRSLIEAGNMSGAEDGMVADMDVSSADSLKKANISQKRKSPGSALAREVMSAEDSQEWEVGVMA